MNGEQLLTFEVFHLFCGLGGGALGFQQAVQEWRGIRGRFRTLGGVDADPEACADFERLTGARATCLDLFAREDYVAFHGHEPPKGWREATPADLLAAAGGERPDVVFMSPPCKSFSGLLPAVLAESPRYQALSRLALRGVWLALEAWRDDPPGLFIFENVPRIAARGRQFLAKIKQLLREYGYEFHEGFHDLGEVGGLAQHRRRYLLVARHPGKVPAYLYRPPKRRVRAVGEALGSLPMPDDPAGGPMHRLPRLSFLTWLRLALIPADGDWRDLQRVEPGRYRLMPLTVAGGSGEEAAGHAADPRFAGAHWPGHFRVMRWDEPARTVTGQGANFGSNSAFAVADPRLPTAHGRRYKGSPGLYGVLSWDKPSQTVTGSAAISGSNTPAAVADPRIGYAPRAGAYRVAAWDRPATTVIGRASVRGSNGVAAVADPRLACAPRSGAYRVISWGSPATTVTGAGDVHAQGAAAVADPRLPTDTEQGVWVIVAEDGTWHRPLTTLELAVLQGFPTTMPDGQPLTLAGRSQARWRERIGNAVPPPAARGIAEMMLLALIPATVGAWILSPLGTAIWVRGLVERYLSRLIVAALQRRARGRRA